MRLNRSEERRASSISAYWSLRDRGSPCELSEGVLIVISLESLLRQPAGLHIHFEKQHSLGGTGVARAAVEVGGSSSHPVRISSPNLICKPSLGDSEIAPPWGRFRSARPATAPAPVTGLNRRKRPAGLILFRGGGHRLTWPERGEWDPSLSKWAEGQANY